MQMTEELREAFAEAERRDRFWADNYEAFLERYPEQMVAAQDGVVVAAAPTLEELLLALHALGLSPQKDVSMQWISKAMRWLVL